MRRVCVVITARPSYSRIKSALVALEARPDVELLIVAGASALVTRYGRIVDQIRADGFEVAAEVSSVIDGDGLHESALSTGVLLNGLAQTFQRLKPDVVVTIADRHETLATAIAASYQHIPLCHVQGGEVTGSIDDKVRNAVTQLADLHLVANDRAAGNVARMGAENIHITGCPSIDLAAEDWATAKGDIEPRLIVLQHPVTGEDAGPQMRATIEAVSRFSHLFEIVYFWPGEDAGGQAMGKEMRLAGIKALRNLPPVDFLRMLHRSRMLVGNSSVGIRECSFLGVPVVNIGTRQAGRARAGNVRDVAQDVESIMAGIYQQMWPHYYDQSTLYGDGHAGERIASVLAGERKEAAA